MASDSGPAWREVAATLTAVTAGVLALALAARALPVPASPFLLGAVAALVYWLVTTSRRRRGN